MFSRNVSDNGAIEKAMKVKKSNKKLSNCTKYLEKSREKKYAKKVGKKLLRSMRTMQPLTRKTSSSIPEKIVPYFEQNIHPAYGESILFLKQRP